MVAFFTLQGTLYFSDIIEFTHYFHKYLINNSLRFHIGDRWLVVLLAGDISYRALHFKGNFLENFDNYTTMLEYGTQLWTLKDKGPLGC